MSWDFQILDMLWRSESLQMTPIYGQGSWGTVSAVCFLLSAFFTDLLLVSARARGPGSRQSLPVLEALSCGFLDPPSLIIHARAHVTSSDARTRTSTGYRMNT